MPIDFTCGSQDTTHIHFPRLVLSRRELLSEVFAEVFGNHAIRLRTKSTVDKPDD